MIDKCRCNRSDVSNPDAPSISVTTEEVNLFIKIVKPNGLRGNYFIISYLGFIAGFFFFKSVKAHNNIFYALILVPYLLTLPWSAIRLTLHSRILQALLILMAYLVTTLLWGVKGTPHDYLQVCIHMLTVFTFFAITSELALRHGWFPRFLLAWICCIGAIAPYLLLLNPHYMIPFPPYRLNDLGVLRNAVLIGDVYGMVILFIYFSMIQRERFIKTLLPLLLLATLLPVFILTQSRGPLVGLYITLLLGGLFTRDSKLLFTLCCITLLAAILLSSGNGFLYNMIVTRGESYRFDIFQHALYLIKQKMLFGHGMLMDFSLKLPDDSIIKHTHSLYLTIWLEGGLMGLFLLMVFMVRAFWQGCIVFFREKDFTYVALILYAAICVTTDNRQIIAHPVPLYLFYWIPIALISVHELKMNYIVDKSDHCSSNDMTKNLRE